MKKNLSKRPVVMASMLAASLASAQSEDPAMPLGITLDPGDEAPRNRFGVNYRMALNVNVDFERLGGFAAMSNPGAALGGGFNRTYDNGYNLRDSSGSAGGYTWNWGYDGSDPMAESGTFNLWNWQGGSGAATGNGITLFSSSSPNTAHKNGVEDGPMHGVEISYGRDLGRWGRGRWGVEGALSFLSMSIDNNSRLQGTVFQTVDSYSLGGVIAPHAPYEGSFEGPGPLLSDSPNRVTTVTPQSATIEGRRRFEGDLFGLRLGPYFEWPLHERVALAANVGLALDMIKSTVSFRETVTIDGVGSQTRRSSSQDTSVLVGAYGGLSAVFALSERWDLAIGGQYQYLGEYSDKADGKKAVADFDDMVFVSLGLGYSF